MSPWCGALAVMLGAFSALADPTLPPLVPGPTERDPSGTEINFLSYKGDETYVVTVAGQSCTTPCALRVRPGPTKVHVVGPGEADLQMVIPHLTAQVRVNTGPPSWYFTAGVVLIPLGILVGVSMWALGFGCGFNGNNSACLAVNFAGWPLLGAAMLITGSVLLGTYNKSQPLDANRPEILDASRERPKPPVRFTGFGLLPLRDGLSGGLSFAF